MLKRFVVIGATIYCFRQHGDYGTKFGNKKLGYVLFFSVLVLFFSVFFNECSEFFSIHCEVRTQNFLNEY